MALSTAGMVAGYMGVGVGATASRYMGRFDEESAGYQKTVRVVLVWALISGAAACLAMFVLAEPLAEWALKNVAFAPLLRVASLSSMALILFETVNGSALGRMRFRAMIVLTLLSSLPLAIVLPLAARLGTSAMVIGQGVVLTVAAVVAAVVLGLTGTALSSTRAPGGDIPSTKSIVGFGGAQFLSAVGVTIASWLVAASVTRADPSLKEMGYYGVGNQVRTLVALVPGLFSQLVFPLLSRFAASDKSSEEVVTLSTYASALACVVVGTAAIITMPWLLAIYGRAYSGAELTCCLLAATAMVHLSGSPVAQYLMTVNLRVATVVSQAGSVSLIASCLLFVGSIGAVGAALAWLIANLIATTLAFIVLAQQRKFPKRAFLYWLAATGTGSALAILAWLKAQEGAAFGALTAVQCGAAGLAVLVLVRSGVRLGYLFPSVQAKEST